MENWSCNPLPHREVAREAWLWIGSEFHAEQGGKAYQISFVCSEYLQCEKEHKVVDCFTSDVMRAIEESVVNGKITCELQSMF